MEIKDELTVTRGGGERGIMGERRRTCTKDPWTWTMGRGLSLGAGIGWAGENNGGKWGQL